MVLVGLAAVLVAGGTSGVTGPEALARAQTTIGGQDLWFAMTTILFQSVVFYLGFGGAYVFPARSERAVKSSTVWMPLYMLIYPFLVFASYYGLKHHPGLKNPNTVFMVTAKGLLPEPVLGLVAAGAALSGVLVLSATALAIGGMVSRNLAPNVRPSAQRRWTVMAVAVFLVLAAVLTLTASTLMLTVLNLTYNLLAQVVPGWLAILFARRVRTAAIATGMVVGVVTAVVLYATGVTLGGLNPGLVSMGVNLVIVFGWSLLAPGKQRSPIALERTENPARSPRSQRVSGRSGRGSRGRHGIPCLPRRPGPSCGGNTH